MSSRFYNSPERIQALDTESRSWINTPFMENSAAKGFGVSCHFLAAAIYKTTGFLPPEFSAPRGSARRLKNGPVNAMVEFVDASLGHRFEKLESDPEPGDMLVIAEDGRAKHIGIVLPGRQFVHVLRHVGVRVSHLDDATYEEVVAIRRPIE